MYKCLQSVSSIDCSFKSVVDSAITATLKATYMVGSVGRSSWPWIKFLWIFLEVKDFTLLSRLYLNVNVMNYLEVIINQNTI